MFLCTWINKPDFCCEQGLDGWVTYCPAGAIQALDNHVWPNVIIYSFILANSRHELYWKSMSDNTNTVFLWSNITWYEMRRVTFFSYAKLQMIGYQFNLKHMEQFSTVIPYFTWERIKNELTGCATTLLFLVINYTKFTSVSLHEAYKMLSIPEHTICVNHLWPFMYYFWPEGWPSVKRNSIV